MHQGDQTFFLVEPENYGDEHNMGSNNSQVIIFNLSQLGRKISNKIFNQVSAFLLEICKKDREASFKYYICLCFLVLELVLCS